LGETATVIVPTKGRLARRPEVLERLLADRACAELLVVTDGEQPATLTLLRRIAAADPRVRWVINPQTGARGQFARHLGATEARESVLVYIDDDVLAEPGLISGHVAHHNREDGLVVLGYMPVSVADTGRRPDYPMRLYGQGYEWMCERYELDPTEVLRNFWGGNYSLRRADALRADAPDSLFTALYHADRDFGLRLTRLGLSPRFDRALHASHAYRRSPAEFVRDSRHSGAGRLLIHQRHSEIIGTLSIDAYERDQPPRTRRLVATCRRWPALTPAASRCLRGAAAVAALAGNRQLELRLGRALRVIEQQRGMLTARKAQRE
jgi:glycosyltransferase involved in cell wall biosynthesis